MKKSGANMAIHAQQNDQLLMILSIRLGIILSLPNDRAR